MRRIEFGELRLGNVARSHILDCFGRHWITAGPKVKLFEERWGKLFGYPHNLAVSSGTDACLNMCLALYATHEARPGDEIIAPALSFVATANAIRAAGFTPVFVDIDRDTLNIDPDKIEKAIRPGKTQAIMVVHTMGRPCAMDRICQIAAQHDLPVLEDCCEAHGARYQGRYVGTFGYAAAFSFYTAHLICCGEGGMVSTMHENVAKVITSTRSHGRRDGQLYFDFPLFGLNSKMNDLEASVGLEGVQDFWKTFDRRHANMMRLHAALAPYTGVVHTSRQDDGNVNCPHGFSLTPTTTYRHGSDFIKESLTKAGIHWKRNFGCVPTQHAAFAYLGYEPGDFPEAEYVGEHGLHFGVHQHLGDDDLDYLEETVVATLARLDTP